jgi:putative DNA primase/helicase
VTGDTLDLDAETWRRVLDEAEGEPPAPGRVADVLADRDVFDVGDPNVAYDVVEAAVERGVLVEDDDAGAFGGVRLAADSAGVSDDSDDAEDDEPVRDHGPDDDRYDDVLGDAAPPDGPRETVVDRLGTADLLDVEGGRFARCEPGGKASFDHADPDKRLDEPPEGRNYAVEATPTDALVLVDVDLYDDAPDGGEPTAGGEQALDALPPTFTVESPHGGRHRYYQVRPDDLGRTAAAALDEAFGAPNPQPSFGEVRAAGQYVVGPGSVLDDCDKAWCDACAGDGGQYDVAADRPLATLDVDDLVGALGLDPELGDGDDDGVQDDLDGVEGDEQDGAAGGTGSDECDLSDRERVEKAREWDDTLDDLLDGRWAAAGYTAEDGTGDRSRGECALALRLGVYLDADEHRVESMIDRYAGSGWKWSDRGDDYRATVLEAVDKVDDPYEWTPSPSPPEDAVANDELRKAAREVARDLLDGGSDDSDERGDGRPDSEAAAVADPDDDQDDDAGADAAADGGAVAGGPTGASGPGTDTTRAVVDVVDEWGLQPRATDGLARRFGLLTEENDRLGDLSNAELSGVVAELIDETDTFHVRYVRETGELWGCESGVWKPHGDDLVAHAVHAAVPRTATSEKLVDEVKAEIRRDPHRTISFDDLGNAGPDDSHYLPVANGLLDLAAAADEVIDPDVTDPADSRAIRDLRPEDYATTRLPVAYDPGADGSRWREFVEQVVEDGRERTIQEYVGYCLVRGESPAHKVLMPVGEGANGKGTFVDTVEAMLGGDNVSNVPPHKFDEDDAVVELKGALANIDADLSNAALTQKAIAMLKKLTGDDTVRGRRLYQDAVDFNPSAKHILVANEVPEVNVSDGDTAFWRRWLIVEFPKTFLPGDPRRDPNLGRKLRDELDGVLNWAIEGYNLLVNDGEPWTFHGDDGPYATRDKWESWGDTLDQFVSDVLVEDRDADPVASREVYEVYKAWAAATGESVERAQSAVTSRLKRETRFNYTDGNLRGRTRRFYNSRARGFRALGFDEDELGFDVDDMLRKRIDGDDDQDDEDDDDGGPANSDLTGY